MSLNYGLFNPIIPTPAEESVDENLASIQTYATSLADTLETDPKDIVATDEVPEERDAAGTSVFQGFLTSSEDHYGQS